METVNIAFGLLMIIGVVTILILNFSQKPAPPADINEGFESGPTPVEERIRNVLRYYDIPQVCSLFETIRNNMLKNEMAGKQISVEEAQARVEKDLALKIPGGALPCPLIVYPKSGSGDLEWLAFLQKFPSDFGARLIFMIIYADETLANQRKVLDDALSGKKSEGFAKGPAEGFAKGPAEGFSVICPPDLATTRRAEKDRKALENCILPEDMTQEQIISQVDTLLLRIVATRNKELKAKGIPFNKDFTESLKRAIINAAYLKQKAAEAESGDLRPTAPPID